VHPEIVRLLQGRNAMRVASSILCTLIVVLGCSDSGDGGAGNAASGSSAGQLGGSAANSSGASATGTAGATSTVGGGGGAATGKVGSIGECAIFPSDNPWNQDVSGFSLHANSVGYIANMAPTKGMHPDWGTWSTDHYGIPFMTGIGAPLQPMDWSEEWGVSESDPNPCPGGTNQFCYPIALTAPIEGGPEASADSDRHVLYIDTAGAPSNCTLYELYNAQNPTGSGGWTAANGAVFHLGSNALRTDGWTSADAAGLPVLPGLVRYEEVAAGEIRHAIRLTMNSTYQGYIHPATHAAGKSNSSLPPMGLRLRLKASFDASTISGPSLVVVTALKKYGLIVADNGSDWYISGESNDAWANYMDNLVSNLGKIHGSDFEVVDTGDVSTAGL
jgi:hypothetical protein